MAVIRAMKSVASKKNRCGNMMIRLSVRGSSIHRSLAKLRKWNLVNTKSKLISAATHRMPMRTREPRADQPAAL